MKTHTQRKCLIKEFYERNTRDSWLNVALQFVSKNQNAPNFLFVLRLQFLFLLET